MKGAIQILSPAKINLFLHITGRRDDGYHTLQTVFQLLNYGDTMRFHPTTGQSVRLIDELAGVENQDNLIVRAAKLLLQHLDRSAPFGVDIHIDKRIPMGGGLGGGSSNAASTLVALNSLWKLGLQRQTLAKLGLQLGADVPVFVHGRNAWAEGIGEDLSPVELPVRWYLVVKPKVSIATAKIFTHKELTRNSEAIKVAAFRESGGRNDCQPLVCRLYPEVAGVIKWLEARAGNALLTGTGACVFSWFSSEYEARQVQSTLSDDWTSFIAHSLDQSPLNEL